MNIRYFVLSLIVTSISAFAGNSTVSIQLSENPDPVQEMAAKKLAHYLGQMYPDNDFSVNSKIPETSYTVLIGTASSFPAYTKHIDTEFLGKPGSFIVKKIGKQESLIIGSDSRATLHGVYTLLEHLGAGFYLSYEVVPRKKTDFSFEEWKLKDAPLAPTRIVFNWHNFLSGCSGWNFSDWKAWVDNAASMRYTDIMVHAYKNNPMFTFTHNGVSRPAGHLATSSKGRDWSTMHLNDVRRIPGGNAFFEQATFGSEAALVPDEKRVQTAQDLMNKVFDEAKAIGMGINFAIDVDTGDPAAILDTLPDEAKFTAGTTLVNPDTPAGYAYYRSMLKSLLQTYPQITNVWVWHRWKLTTPWTTLPPEDFPNDTWRTEFGKIVEKYPHLKDDPYASGQYAISHIVRAFRKAMDELGFVDVKLGVGTWRFPHLKAADVFMPDGVTFMALDYGREFGSDSLRKLLSELKHPFIPIVWAHHDDGAYLGRPYTPFPDFCSELERQKTDGFGVIHWTMRPLDMFFKSLSEQVWLNTKDQPLQETCNNMAQRIFGNSDDLGGYLYQWVTKGPIFGRETLDYFMWEPFDNMEVLLSNSQKRLDILKSIDKLNMTAQQKAHLDYFKDFESFCMEFIRNQNMLWKAKKQISTKMGDLQSYRKIVSHLKPESVIQTYVKAISNGDTTQSEKGLAVTLSTQWLPYFIEQRQLAGSEPIRINFSPTQHEDLAAMPGKRTFFIDKDGNYWRALGERETQIPVFSNPVNKTGISAIDEIARTGIKISKTFNLKIKNLLDGPQSDGQFHDGHISPGKYRLNLIFLNTAGNASTQSIANILLPDGTEQKIRADQSGPFQVSYPVELNKDFAPIAIKPLADHVGLCGLWLDPIDVNLPEPYGLRVAEASGSSASGDSDVELTLDNNLNTKWLTPDKKGGILYDFGRIRKLSEVKIAWLNGESRRQQFKIDVSSDKRNWQSIFAGHSSGYTSSMETYSFKPVRARFLRIHNLGNTKDDSMSISEIEFHRTQSKHPDGLRIYDIKASEPTNPEHEYSPRKAIDVNPGTRWAANGKGQWIQFRLDHRAMVETVKIQWFGHKRSYAFEIQASPNGKNWKTVSSHTSSNTPGLDEFTLKAVHAPWLRLLCHGNNENTWNSILECEIHGFLKN
ncbi:F5/8 type C domain protein [Limihaloglobus sulfuriphilus]|uniref:F5/8 type C domain protein n=1 Tax=Limihaloglobus sulfuriphilus TaxID=1851148 RepID=A0A1Q2ME45_9BACT|nr:discoidin domain-containing protein [Limihaloglobus sulfuriphilus]AQQ70940.1 F5/8 type C domain protein [Limihaloglobus sulfuriphilus]